MGIRKCFTLLLVAFLLVSPFVNPVNVQARPDDGLETLAPEATITIAEARALANGESATVQGTISAPIGVHRSDELWVQDDTAGIDVYGVSPSGLQLGDIVEISGEIDEYNGKKEIVPTAANDVVLVDRGVPPAPIMTNTVNISEASEGWLVVVTGTVSSAGGSEFFMDDGSGQAKVYVDSDTGIDASWIQDNDWLTLVGISSDYNGPQLLPRYQYDIAKGDVMPIALARQKNDGDIVTVQGAVTALPGTFENVAENREFYVQDGTAGIDVFNYGGLPIPAGTLSIGDIVTVSGEIDFYNGKMEIIPTDIVMQGLNSPIEPKVQLAGNISEETEGLLVVITGTVSSKSSSGFDLSDASGTTAVYVDGDTGIDLSDIENDDMVRVTGLSAQHDRSAPYDSDYQVTLRTQADLVEVTADVMPPSVQSTSPAADATDANPNFAVKAMFNEALDGTTVNASTFTLEDADGPVAGTVYYDGGHMAAVFDPDMALEVGATYTATVKAAVTDEAGNDLGADYVWSFITAEATFAAYHGSLHNHTAYSDGTADPDTAFTQGRARGLDFMAVTDHSYSIDDVEWADTLAQANAHTEDDVYVALRGCEYTQGTEGHINVYNTTRHPVRNDVAYTYADYTPALTDFYDWIAEHPEAVGMFNHPGWMNFNDWEYRADAEPMMQLLEIGNGAYSYYVWTEEEYRKALDYGWYVGPSNNGDTHSDEWAIDNPGRTGVWAAELTQEGVLEAMDAMRTFATEDGNFELSLKADGAWMGEIIPNDGSIDFEIYVNDPDDETLVSLELYTDQGIVVTSTVPTSSEATWSFSLDVSEGIHYYFVRAVQEDGDRTVSAPIWTEGDVDVAPTKLEITPAQLSTQAPANFSARVTNRGVSDVTDITVTFKVGATVIGTKFVTVTAGSDAFAAIGWTPDITGPVTIAAEISGVPEGDNLDDNAISLERNIVDEEVPLIVIDNGHKNNVFASGDGNEFEQDLVEYGFNWIEDTDGLTAADLASAVLLVISDPGGQGEDLYDEAEEQVIADYVNNGGAILFAGDSDYHDHGNSDEINSILDKINDATIRMNSDGTYDDTNNGGVGPWHVLWHNFPATDTVGIGVNVEMLVGFSGCSIYGLDTSATPVALTTGNGVTVTVQGDEDTYQNDGDGLGDHFVYPEDMLIPMAAVQKLPGGGRIAVWGDSSEAFSDSYTYVPGDGYQNEIYNMETIYWLLGHPLEKSDIGKVRVDAELNDTPDYLDRLVWIEGTVTAGYGTFFDVLYVQDETGGVTVYAPVTGETSPDQGGQTMTIEYLGTRVRVVGRVELYQKDTEVQVDWDLEQIQVIGRDVLPNPLVFSTYESALEANEGWLVQTEGRVITKTNNYNFLVDDGSGTSRIFIDGYNGDFADIQVNDWAKIMGLASEDGVGQRIRVRKRVDVLAESAPIVGISKAVTPAADVDLGSNLTYTVIVANLGNADTTAVTVTDMLPLGVTGQDLSWTGLITAGEQVAFKIPVVLTTSAEFTGQSITNTATFTNPTAYIYGETEAQAVFTIAGENYIYLPILVRNF